jgi:hypothetical protein
MNPNPGFFIEATDAGQERVMCLSHEKDLLADVTTGVLATPPLNPIKGETLESINARFEGLSNDGMLGSGSVGWEVRLKTPAVVVAPTPAPAAAQPKSN